MEPVICRTVGELIEALKAYPPETVPYGIEPPFNGVSLVPQDNGFVLIGRTRRLEKNEDVYGNPRAA